VWFWRGHTAPNLIRRLPSGDLFAFGTRGDYDMVGTMRWVFILVGLFQVRAQWAYQKNLITERHRIAMK